MTRIVEFLKTTVVGGLVFLVPLVLVMMVLKRAFEVAAKVATPVVSHFPANQVAGIALGSLAAVVLLLMIAFAAGLAARTDTGRAMTRWVGESFLGAMPQYRVVTSMAEGLTKIEQGKGLRPALVAAEGTWQLCYVLEELGRGWTAVFIPQAPTPLSGNVLYVPADRVRRLDINIGEAMQLVKHMGAGSAGSLKDVDLTPPEAR
ncbi:MAG: hypothetical protein U1F08_09435 [Steroidobacteraceae bacterium]